MAGIRQPMCNPIGQAAILDGEGSELNIILGLCVGDDTLFIEHSKAPVSLFRPRSRRDFQCLFGHVIRASRDRLLFERVSNDWKP